MVVGYIHCIEQTWLKTGRIHLNKGTTRVQKGEASSKEDRLLVGNCLAGIAAVMEIEY